MLIRDQFEGIAVAVYSLRKMEKLIQTCNGRIQCDDLDLLFNCRYSHCQSVFSKMRTLHRSDNATSDVPQKTELQFAGIFV